MRSSVSNLAVIDLRFAVSHSSATFGGYFHSDRLLATLLIMWKTAPIASGHRFKGTLASVSRHLPCVATFSPRRSLFLCYK